METVETALPNALSLDDQAQHFEGLSNFLGMSTRTVSEFKALHARTFGRRWSLVANV